MSPDDLSQFSMLDERRHWHPRRCRRDAHGLAVAYEAVVARCGNEREAAPQSWRQADPN